MFLILDDNLRILVKSELWHSLAKKSPFLSKSAPKFYGATDRSSDFSKYALHNLFFDYNNVLPKSKTNFWHYTKN